MYEEDQGFDTSDIRQKVFSVLPDGWTIKSITRNCVKITCPAKDYFAGNYDELSKKIHSIEDAADAKYDGGGIRCGVKVCTDTAYDMWFYFKKPIAQD